MPVLIPHERLAAKGISYSKPHLWRLEKFHREVIAGTKEKTSAPLFPLRVHLGPNKYAYVEPEIDTYVAELIANRDDGVDPVPLPKSPKRPAPAPEPLGQADAPLHEPDKPSRDRPPKKRPAPAATEPV